MLPEAVIDLSKISYDGRNGAAMIMLPTRSRRYGVGKEIGGAVYLHRNYERLPGKPIQQAKMKVPADFAFTVIKYSFRTGNVTFITSPDFDTAPEPTVGDHWIVSAEGKTRFRPALSDPYIYHHKWLMVSDDYSGFDVEESKARSRLWLSIPDIDKSRIGRRNYWQKQVTYHISRSS
jgi:hypothetical protein